MFVKAPVLFANGSTTSTKRTYRIEAGGSSVPTYPTIDIAFLHAGERAATFTARDGDTVKSLRQNGVIGFRRYKNTPYRASYKSYSQDGEIQLVTRKSSGNFIPEVIPVVLGPDTTSYSTFAIDKLADLDPKGSRSTVEAIANRTLLANLVNRANAELRVKSQRKTFDAAESFADIDKTVLLIAQRTTQVLRAWRALRKGNVEGAMLILNIKRLKHANPRNIVDQLPQLWLELQYGWLPLVNDIFDGFNTVKTWFEPSKPPSFSVVRRLETELFVGDTSLSSTRFNSYGQKASAFGRVEMRYRLCVADPEMALIQSLGLMNPLSVLWEQLPYSFVIDWLLPVGTLLQALTAPVGLKFMSGYCSYVTYGEQTVWSDSAKPIFAYALQAQRGRASSTAKALYMARDVLTTWPGLMPYIRFPFTSTQRVANAAALLLSSRSFR